MRDVRIHAPSAELFLGLTGPRAAAFDTLEPPSPAEIIQMLEIENRRLRSELQQLRVTANTIANTAACLAALAEPDHDGWVTVPRELRERMRDDVKLSVRSTEEGTQIRWVTRPADHVFEGRADG